MALCVLRGTSLLYLPVEIVITVLLIGLHSRDHDTLELILVSVLFKGDLTILDALEQTLKLCKFFSVL